METLPSSPISNRGLISYSWVLYRASFSRVFILSLLMSFAVFIPRFLSLIIGQDIFLNLPPLSPHRLWIVVVDLIALTFFVGILWRMHCISINRFEPLVEDIRVGLKKAILIFITTFIQSSLVFATAMIIYGLQILLHKHNLLFSMNLMGMLFTIFIFVLQLFLLLYVAILFLFMVPIIATENKSIFSAFERSVYLAWNHFWRILSLQITPWVCYLITLMILRAFGLDIHIYFMDQTTHHLIPVIIHLLLFALYIPWVASLLLVQMRDLELRKHIAVS